jgi:hypothetical protein
LKGKRSLYGDTSLAIEYMVVHALQNADALEARLILPSQRERR